MSISTPSATPALARFFTVYSPHKPWEQYTHEEMEEMLDAWSSEGGKVISNTDIAADTETKTVKLFCRPRPYQIPRHFHWTMGGCLFWMAKRSFAERVVMIPDLMLDLFEACGIPPKTSWAALKELEEAKVYRRIRSGYVDLCDHSDDPIITAEMTVHDDVKEG